MNQFYKFKKDFDDKYRYIDEFIWHIYRKTEDFNITPFNCELKAEQDDTLYDSYGSENSNIFVVYYFPDYDIYVKFIGNRASYQGEEWIKMEEVKPVEKTIQIYEPM